MKYLQLPFMGLLAVAFVLTGCSKKSEVDTAKVEQSFASAEPQTKSEADSAVSAIKAGNYQAALGPLQKLASQAKLTPEQKAAVQDVIDQVQKQLSATATKAAEGAEKALGDVKKGLPQ